ncbi:DNA repair protein RecO [Candidatus Nomurabacteria bacterium RIFCSPHIGHO2_02_FULL_41_18]|uniref:DNA repair protein RecO n=1 Tax=Candidatus Nomurabacteria bacterium RIFCSPHIGHO2_02_FULL_41_18 TaxID=1801754 RepID=A0A1F6W8D5_9BACT|nr:MAG: DNA repair protein RecO [Candidatus Nomurabacteria bacterium RIFCSPHIGHO2_01_FULL_41_71]OGI78052.1 MAG: DNA repair protein RecO [Candidatus Nomurabacteria bacterium RIFCSPHIGHO2_02_FULL_41_18]OGI90107.1 MAG: DNA repair protein RecO [Candidatus Nomurabacteria bacterium RIFCSPLOWO2_01_FULL_41_52b]OGJ00201.1 MAG: DNA repair protein RecO [Candidatus Nomurabacteria bacterium RIFCSPLOWO2_02_FULL_41_9]
MHHIYHTEGIILGSRNFGEAGKYYYIFTRDLGMIYARAQGVRKLSSKLRYILQDFSHVKVDLVRGRDFWRVTSASKTGKLEKLAKNPKTFRIFTNMAYLLRRLLSGEYPNEALFDDLVGGLFILESIKMNQFSDTQGKLEDVETVIVLRILNNLGYIGSRDKWNVFVKSPFEKDLILKVAKNRGEILNEVNKALKETHL